MPEPSSPFPPPAGPPDSPWQPRQPPASPPDLPVTPGGPPPVLPGEPAGPAGSPWKPAPARSGPGCSKPLLIGCGGLLVLLAIGAILFIVNAQSLVQWYFEKLEDTVAARLPADVTPAERQRLHGAFAGVRHALANGTANPTRMQPFQRMLMEVAGSDKKMTHEQLADLSRSLEGLAQKPAPAAPPATGAPAAPRPPPAAPSAHP